MIICLIIHLIILIIAFFGVIPFKQFYNTSYYELFEKSAPLFFKTMFGVLVSFVFYFIAYKLFFTYNYIDNFNSFICFISIFTIGVILFIILYFIFKSEILYPTDDFKNNNKNLIPFMILYLYATSIIYSCGIVFFTNSFLDFRKQEEITVTIGHKELKMGVSKGEGNHFNLFISPTVEGVNPIEVPSEIYWGANKGDKLKLYICQGLYGQRYFSNSMNLIK